MNSQFTYPKILTSIRLEKSTLTWMENEIFRIEIKEQVEILKEDLEAIQPIKLTLSENKPHCVLFIMPRFGSLTKGVREFSASQAANLNAIAKAVIAPNLGMRIIANFFISRNKPPIPHKVFTKQEDAILWLIEQKNEFVLLNKEAIES